jgi:hypothetical protein
MQATLCNRFIEASAKNPNDRRECGFVDDLLKREK